MNLALLSIFLALPGAAQISVSMDIMPSDGSAPQVGRGISAYTVNIHVVGAGPAPISFAAVRQAFPEVRLYSIEQGNDILSMRVERSPAARATKLLGYSTAAAGVGISVEQKLSKSPSWLGDAMTAGGLAVPIVDAMLTKAIPSYKITNPPPDRISLQPNEGAEYTWLCARGKAPVTIPARLISPISIKENQ